MLPCNPKVGVHFSHIVLLGNFLFQLCVMGKSTCCTPPFYNITFLLLCVQFVLSTPLVGTVMYQLISCSEHLYHMSVLELDMADAVIFLVSYEQIGAIIFLHTRSLIRLHTVLYIPIFLIYQSIIFLPNVL